MKTIIIATDFSEASRQASLYGVQLAKELNANIILFNAYTVPHPAAGLNICISRYDVKAQIEQRLLNEADFLDPEKRMIEVLCDEGVAADAIMNIANEKSADFIIAGMKGNRKNFRKLFGSTAGSLAAKTNIPLLIIPENTIFKTPEIFVFGGDVRGVSRFSPKLLCRIKSLFKAKSYTANAITGKDANGLEVSRLHPNINKPAGLSDQFFYYYSGKDRPHTLKKFTNEHSADVLVLPSSYEHDCMDRFFTKSEIKDMIFHSQIPLLIMPADELEDDTKEMVMNEERIKYPAVASSIQAFFKKVFFTSSLFSRQRVLS